jgi:lipopolysaccharide heptosyltransferase I
MPRPPIRALDARRVLIVRLTALGDVVNALPALAALRQMLPTAHIAWAVEPPLDQLLRGHPALNQIIPVPRGRWQQALRSPLRWPAVWREFREVKRQLRHGKFDVALDIQGNLRSALIASFSHARYRIGFAPPHARELSYLIDNLHVVLPPRKVHRVEQAMRLLACLGDVPPEPEPFVPIGRGDRNLVREFFERSFRGPGLVAVLHPGVSRFGRYKQWPEPRYAELADLLAQRLGIRSLLTWGPGEREMAERIAAQAGSQPVVGPQIASIKQLAALIQRADLFISADSGPSRLAWALGTPLVAIFGPKDPAIYGPHSGPFRVVERELPCRPCRRRTCADPQCVAAISPEEVYRAARDLIQG